MKHSTVRTLINELGRECENVMTLIHQLQLPNITDRQRVRILTELLAASIHLNSHCDKSFQAIIAQEIEKLSDEE
ncbi:MAG: hypothetical protein J7641_23410 [Cyanobacteria bacterium SID2]|nr:hypothetical protein [Cyanobacteria bacterium SID2]MBP0002967.1 hypothetical protein [Cyanobacteria bacterium SBC]